MDHGPIIAKVQLVVVQQEFPQALLATSILFAAFQYFSFCLISSP